MVSTDEEAKAFILRVTAKLRPQDFAFSVDGPDDIAWDVYKFRTPEDEHPVLTEHGTLALRIVDGHLEIGFFRYGHHHTPDDIFEALCATSN